MQDNDPKHTLLYAKEWIDENEVNWWKTPAESPNLNLIENRWHELNRRRSETKDQRQGIVEFLGTVVKS